MSAAADQAYARLKQALVAGGYAPGAPLKEEHLARELGLSRAPVRAALKRLVDAGLAEAEAGRGVRAARWTEADIQETFDLRALLEGRAAELAAARGGPALADRLDLLNARMAAAMEQGAADRPARLQAINAEFHHAIVQASGSPRLRVLLAGLIDMPIVIRSYFISTPADLAQSLQHHRDLTSAVRAGDAAIAGQAMRLHLNLAAQRFRQRRGEFGAPPGGGA
jgi:DNA-binding GntR family transcriptional regulator